MNQRWLWNFPEGPCSPCCFPSDCQSLTSALAAIGWRANRLRRYWSAALCHTDQCAGSPLPLKKHFCCNAVISPALNDLVFFSLVCPFWLWQRKPGGIHNKAFHEVKFKVAINKKNCSTIQHQPPCLQAALPQIRGPDNLFSAPRQHTLGTNQPNIYTTCSLC